MGGRGCGVLEGRVVVVDGRGCGLLEGCVVVVDGCGNSLLEEGRDGHGCSLLEEGVPGMCEMNVCVEEALEVSPHLDMWKMSCFFCSAVALLS